MRQFIYLLVLVFFVSCDTDDTFDVRKEGNLSSNEDKEKVTLILDDEKEDLLKGLISVGKDKILFTKESFSHLENMEYIVATPLEKAPEGFLRKIKTIDQQNDQLVITTENVEINELIPTIDHESEYRFESLSTSEIETEDGDVVSYRSVRKNNRSLGQFRINLDRVVFDADGNHSTTHDQIKVKGSATIEPKLDLKLQSFFGVVQEFKNVVTFENQMDLDLVWNYNHSLFNHSIPITKLDLPHTVVYVGWLPVVMRHSLNISFDVNGSLNASISTGVTGKTSYQKGVHYYNNRWHFINKPNFRELRFKNLVAKGNLSLSAELSGKFETVFYEVISVGVRGNAGFYLDANVVLSSDNKHNINWFLGAKASLGAYVRAGLFGLPGLSYTWDYNIWSERWPITEGVIPLGDTNRELGDKIKSFNDNYYSVDEG